MPSYAQEANWWKKRASEYQGKRASLQPLSYSYASDAYAGRGNYNGAASLDAMRLQIYKEAEIENRKNLEEVTNAIYTKPLTKSQKEREAREAAARAPKNSVVQPSQDIKDQDSSVQQVADKITGVGSAVGRTLIPGFFRLIDVVSRTTYAAQNVRLTAIEDTKKSGGDISAAEHIQIAVEPFLQWSPPSIVADMLGNSAAEEGHAAMKEGLTGRSKATGIDALRAEYPNWTKEHTILTAVGGFASDIASDPLTYLTMGGGTTVARSAGAGATRLMGKKAYSQSLLDQTIWTPAGRASGLSTLKSNILLSRSAKELRAQRLAGWKASRSGKKVKKGQKKFDKGKLDEKKFNQRKKTLGEREAHYELAKDAYTSAVAKSFADEVLGVADVGRYALKHPFKAGGSFGQGMRGGSAVKGSSQARAVHAATVAATAAELKAPGSAVGDPLRLMWAKKQGTTIKSGNTVIEIGPDFDKFVDEVAAALHGRFIEVTQHTRKALRSRYGVNAQRKAEQYAFWNKLQETLDGSLNDAIPYADNVKGMGYSDQPEMTLAQGYKPDPGHRLPDMDNIPGNENPIDTLEKLRATHEAQTVDEFLTAGAVNRTAREVNGQELLANRPPEMVANDTAMGLSDGQIIAREHYKGIAKKVLDKAGIENEGGVINPSPTGTPQSPNYTTADNMAIARALEQINEEAIDTLALRSFMDDPAVIVRSYMDTADDILNRVSADTHVQVMQHLHLRYGMSMPSRNMSRRHVDDLFDSGDIYDGAGKNPEFTAKAYTRYLTKRITDRVGPLSDARDWADNDDLWQALDVLDVTPHITGSQTQSKSKMAAQDLLKELEQSAVQLGQLHYGQDVPGIDKYTMLDHIVFGRGPTEELVSGKAGIGRLAPQAHEFNTNGIPAYSPEVLDQLARLDELEKDIIEAYARIARGNTGRDPGEILAIKTPKQVQELFQEVRRSFALPDLRRVASSTEAVDPQKMLRSLGAHLDLLHNTTETQGFSTAWRRQIASNIWGMPAKKVDGKFVPGKWGRAWIFWRTVSGFAPPPPSTNS